MRQRRCFKIPMKCGPWIYFFASALFSLGVSSLIVSAAALAEDEELPTIQGLPSQDDFQEVTPLVPSAVRGQLVEGFFYDPAGKRDPFSPPESMIPRETRPTAQAPASGSLNEQRQEMLTSVPLSEIQLIGIMWSPDDPRAMFQLPNSRVVIVRPRNKIGLELALVASIREGEVLVILPNLEGNYEQGEVVSIKLRR